MRIEVGYGLEARLTDAVTRQILDDRVRPRFRANDFDGGIEAGPPYGGVIACGAWIVLYPILHLWLAPGTTDFKARHPTFAGFTGGSGRSGSGGGWSSGGGGGGFSGGGGSFGGGGSSSSW
jgi:uncharacterized protein